jgi:hypothetical protein
MLTEVVKTKLIVLETTNRDIVTRVKKIWLVS